jgi:hypothetical protein
MTHDTPHVTVTFARALLEHPRALHLKRLRSAIYLYLALLARLPAGERELELRPAELAAAMGLREGTIRSWLGHLRHAGYLACGDRNGTVRVRLEGPLTARPVPPAPVDARSAFTVEDIQQALGEHGGDAQLARALADHPDAVLQRALAGALAPAAREIRRSRIALFLYLVKKYDPSTPHHPRP